LTIKPFKEMKWYKYCLKIAGSMKAIIGRAVTAFLCVKGAMHCIASKFAVFFKNNNSVVV
jgi:hypothetical protein